MATATNPTHMFEQSPSSEQDDHDVVSITTSTYHPQGDVELHPVQGEAEDSDTNELRRIEPIKSPRYECFSFSHSTM